MRVLALDFDGVICNSSREAFTVALRTFAELSPRTRTAEHGLVRSSGAAISEFPFDQDPVYERFCELLPLGNRAEDFGVALGAIEEGSLVRDQADYDGLYGRHDREWLARFHTTFYTARSRFRAENPELWRSLHRAYEPFVQMLQRNAGRRKLALVTAKDRASVDILLEAYGLTPLFPPALILDKEAGESKTAHLRLVQSRTRASWRQITFVDDKVNHLETTAPLGVQGVLAGWGHNTPREHALAKRSGFPVVHLDTAESTLFG